MHSPTDAEIRQVIPRLLSIKKGAVVAQPLSEDHVREGRRTLLAAAEFWQLGHFGHIERVHTVHAC